MPNNPQASTTTSEHLTVAHTVQDLIYHKAFTGYGELLLPFDENSNYYTLPLSQIARTMPYHSNVHPNVVLNAVNHLIDEVDKGKLSSITFILTMRKNKILASKTQDSSFSWQTRGSVCYNMPWRWFLIHRFFARRLSSG